MADDAPREIPEGRVTVLFTDLVDSTQLNQSLGDDAAREVGSQVEQMARGVVAGNRGVLIKEMGDGLMAAFASAQRAVAAARDIQVEMGRFHRGGLVVVDLGVDEAGAVVERSLGGNWAGMTKAERAQERRRRKSKAA